MGCALSAVDLLTIEIEENKSLNFSKGCALFLVDWLTLETRENRGLIFSRGCALSLVDWLTIENQGLIFSSGCAHTPLKKLALDFLEFPKSTSQPTKAQTHLKKLRPRIPRFSIVNQSTTESAHP